MKRVDIPVWFHRVSMIILLISFLCGIEGGDLAPIVIGLVCLFVLAFVAVFLENAAMRGEQ